MDLETYLSTRGMTDAAFAAQVGLERSVVTRLRNKKATPSMASAARIFDATDGAVTPNDFLPKQIAEAAE